VEHATPSNKPHNSHSNNPDYWLKHVPHVLMPIAFRLIKNSCRITKVVPELSILAFPGNCVPKRMPHGISRTANSDSHNYPWLWPNVACKYWKGSNPKIEKSQKGQV